MKKLLSLALICLFCLSACTNTADVESSNHHERHSFVSSMGCEDENCTDSAHYHDCDENCDDPAHYHNCDANCSDAEHHHGKDHHEELHHQQ